jgi:hypothetical protein
LQINLWTNKINYYSVKTQKKERGRETRQTHIYRHKYTHTFPASCCMMSSIPSGLCHKRGITRYASPPCASESWPKIQFIMTQDIVYHLFLTSSLWYCYWQQKSNNTATNDQWCSNSEITGNRYWSSLYCFRSSYVCRKHC